MMIESVELYKQIFEFFYDYKNNESIKLFQILCFRSVIDARYFFKALKFPQIL